MIGPADIEDMLSDWVDDQARANGAPAPKAPAWPVPADRPPAEARDAAPPREDAAPPRETARPERGLFFPMMFSPFGRR